jgi:glc operon protein GlcG
MKRIHTVGLLWVILALAATASAQNAPSSQFVIGGETAKKIHDFTTINLATAERLAETCENLARKEGVAISVYILDNEGNHVYMHRMDGQGYLNIVTAEMKARTALLLRAPSKTRMNQVIQNPDSELQAIQIGFFPNSGGLPIIVNDQLIGAIGVGGSAPRVAQGWSDEICAHKAMTEVFGPQPPLIEDLPPRPAANRGNAPVPRFDLAQGVVPRSSLPPEFVVSGKAAANIFDANQISSEAAKKIARTCRAWAAEHGGTASIYIIDTHGTFVHQERGDGQIYANIHTAMLKAQTALQTRQPTSIRTAQLRNDPRGIPRQLVQFGFFTNSGGIPIVVDGEMIGAIGVGGGAGGGDENCAIAGLKAAFGDHVLLPVYPQKKE